jgi:long-chain acyl-CoA synthetase
MVTRPTGSTLQELAEEAWARHGEASVLWFEGTRFSGPQLADRARRLSGGLRAAGLAPGDRVVVCMANCPEVGVSYQGLWRAGAVATPVLFLLSEDELRHVLLDSGATTAITTPELIGKLLAAAAGVDSLQRIVLVGPEPVVATAAAADPRVVSFAALEAAEPGPLVTADPAAMAALLYTGGTTGRSKGVVLSHDALSASAWSALAGALEGGDDPAVTLSPLPLAHVYGLMLSIGAMHLPTGRTSVLMRWFDAPGFLQLVQEHRVESAAVVPAMLLALLQQPLESFDLTSLRRIGSGGAPLPAEAVDRLHARLPGVEVSEGYGCTETAAIISTSPPGAARAGSVGRPAHGVTVRIERPDGSDARPGEDGEICVRTAGLMTGYWHAPEETAHAMRGGWLHTGDIGHRDDDGYLYVVDRTKDLIIRNGINIYPRDVEEALMRHPDVTAVAVVGRPDARTGEEVVAFATARSGSGLTADDLVAFGRAHLSAVKYPREVRLVDAIPLTSVGKLDRKALRSILG